MTKANLGKQKISQSMIYLMNKILSTRSKNFDGQLSYYLDLRKKNSNSKASTVRKILGDIKKSKDTSLIRYEKKFSGIKKLNKKTFKCYFFNLLWQRIPMSELVV